MYWTGPAQERDQWRALVNGSKMLESSQPLSSLVTYIYNSMHACNKELIMVPHSTKIRSMQMC
jgi:hypothetical protein